MRFSERRYIAANSYQVLPTNFPQQVLMPWLMRLAGIRRNGSINRRLM
jgi:hypothetical protein